MIQKVTKQQHKDTLSHLNVPKFSYAALEEMERRGKLEAGKRYAFRHKNYHLIHGSGGVESDDTIDAVEEVFIATALTNDTFSKEVLSLDYPEDLIRYDFDSSLWGDLKSTRSQGMVTYRMGFLDNGDGLYTVEARFDWRRCIYRTWHADFSAISGDVTMDDEPGLYAPSVSIGKNSASNARLAINDNGNFTDSLALPLSNIATSLEWFSNYIRLGTYNQNVVVLPLRDNPEVPFVVNGDFSYCKDVRTLGDLINTDRFATGNWNENLGNVENRCTVSGYIHVPYLNNQGQYGSLLSASRITSCISFFPRTALSGDAWVECTFIPRLVDSFWFSLIYGEAKGLIERCVLNGATSNGYFIQTDYDPFILENCSNMNFAGFSSNTAQRKRLVNALGGYLATPQTIAITSTHYNDIKCNNVFSAAINPAANVLTIPDASGHIGKVTGCVGTMTTITRNTVFKHRLVITVGGAGLTVNAGGNIINAAGTAYSSGDKLVIDEIEDNVYAIVAGL